MKVTASDVSAVSMLCCSKSSRDCTAQIDDVTHYVKAMKEERGYCVTNLVDVLVEVAHLVAEHASEATEDVAVQRVVLETHLRLHLAILDADRSELRERLCRVERLARCPEARHSRCDVTCIYVHSIDE